MAVQKKKFRVIGYKEGRLTDPKDIVYDTETHNFTGLVCCVHWALEKGSKSVLILKRS